MSKVYLILENGRVFEGESFGAEGETIGELVFTTGVVGYVETLTDPSYAGQIIMHTFPERPRLKNFLINLIRTPDFASAI